MTTTCVLCRKNAAVYIDRKQRALCAVCLDRRDRMAVKAAVGGETVVQGRLEL